MLSRTTLTPLRVVLLLRWCSNREFVCRHNGLESHELYFRMRGGKTDENRVAEYKATLNAKMDVYEKILSKRKYLAGDVCQQKCSRAQFHIIFFSPLPSQTFSIYPMAP